MGLADAEPCVLIPVSWYQARILSSKQIQSTAGARLVDIARTPLSRCSRCGNFSNRFREGHDHQNGATLLGEPCSKPG